MQRENKNKHQTSAIGNCELVSQFENGHTFDGGEEPFDAEAVMRVIAENAKG